MTTITYPQKYLLKSLLEKGCNDVVLNKYNFKKTQLKFANNEIVLTTNWESENIGVFVSYDEKTVVTDISEFSKKELDVSVQKIVNFAKQMQKNDEFRAIAKGPFRYKQAKDYFDPAIHKINAIDMVNSGINAAIKNGAKRCSGILELESYDKEILTSGNIHAKDKGSFAYFSIRANYDMTASGYQNQVSPFAKKINAAKLGAKAGEISAMSKNSEKLPPGKFDVIFDSYPFAGIIERLGSAASINAVESGFSCLANRINKKIASGNFTLCDDGTYKGAIGSELFDDEGHPHSNVRIVDKGKLKTYLHNTSTSIRYKTKNTGNAGILAPHNTNLVVDSGKSKNVLEGFTGLFVTNIWYTRFQNYVTGDFSTIPRDGIFLYKNGKIIKPVRDIRITDNLLRIFSSIQSMSRERFQHKGWEVEIPVICPVANIKDVNVTTSNE